MIAEDPHARSDMKCLPAFERPGKVGVVRSLTCFQRIAYTTVSGALRLRGEVVVVVDYVPTDIDSIPIFP